MTKINKITITTIAATAAIFYVLFQPSVATVTAVIDGDTIVGNNTRTIRIARINSPEIYNKYTHKKTEPGANEAKTALNKLTYHKQVLLLKDPTQANTDKYNRNIRFVFLGFTNVSNYMVENNYAKPDTRRTQ